MVEFGLEAAFVGICVVCIGQGAHRFEGGTLCFGGLLTVTGLLLAFADYVTD